MRRAVVIAGVVLAAGAAALWAAGGLGAAEVWLRGAQRAAQDALAAPVRALRAGQPGALAALLAASFAYGFLHAAGPGHGKMLIGGYGLARRVPMLRLGGVAVAASLAQAAVAVALVHGGIALFGWTRAQVTGAAEATLLPVGHALIAALGLWLVWRGVRALWPARAAAHGTGHATGRGHDHPAHGHAHGAACGDCGHRHGPDLAEVQALSGWRDTALLIGGIAMRPCTGALFLLILTWQLAIPGAGIAGAFAMGAGTAALTVAVAAMAVWTREGAFAAWPGLLRLRATLPAVEIAAGVVMAGAALTLLLA
jgi:ABC-type nickel/cobalt efflux system permease component RcnA